MKHSVLLIILFLISFSIFGQTNFQKHFDSLGLKGSTTIFDYKNKTWTFTDEKDSERETLPASTFKIPNSLFALEYHAVRDENEVLIWDGVERNHLGNVIDVWNQDTDLKTAFRNSTIWFYVEVSKRLGRQRYRDVLRKCRYGNGNLSEKGDDFWNYGDFAVSPKNQIAFLVKLYEEKLPFSPATMTRVKEIMVSEKTDEHIYRDKTGWTRKNGVDIGWWVGYLETKDNLYFFATRIEKGENDGNPHFSKGRKEITKKILSEVIKKCKG